MIYRFLIKPILFLFPAEKAHHLSTWLFSLINSIPVLKHINKAIFKLDDSRLEKTVFGITFPNPVGLAAGFDKDGKHYKAMASLGFGFIEIGTVTPKGQSGNPIPRLFRLPKDNSLINRMGFNNDGVDAMVTRIRKDKTRNIIIGGNIGKNKVTPNDEAVLDYEISFEKLYPYVDYFVINVSSPNTPDLRSLQEKEPLKKLLSRIVELRNQKEERKPILLKIAPDLSTGQIDDVLEILTELNVDGIIASNTTISRKDLKTSDSRLQKIGNGGLSGQALTHKSLEIVKYIRSKSENLPIIGVGGISSPQAALDMLSAGADLIQVYSGLIYQGPHFVKNIKKSILQNI